MGTEVGHSSEDIQTTVTTPFTAPKTSMFAKRAGFVIPKNRLSGSLVPVIRGAKKGDADSMSEEATKQVQRKTKWGSDLTVDATVRKVKALAYQTRINQISQQLTLGVLELEDNEDSFFISESDHGKASDHQLSHEESEQLELERREIIGEILKLNPAFKSPTDYKPMLKEEKVPIPIKEHPGCNFISLVFGPSSDTQKRVEKETGAKVQVYGTKADTGGLVEITPDGKVDNSAYEHIYVNVSADTYEKVDAAVALIELLLTSISVNPVSSSTTSTVASDDNVDQSMRGSVMAPALTNQGTAQPYPNSLQLPQGQFPQYSQAWFPAGPTQTPASQQAGLVTPSNTSAAFLTNTALVSSSPANPLSMPSFGPRSVMPASFSPVLQNHSAPPSGPQPSYMQHIQTGGPRPSYMQPTHSLTGPHLHNLPLTSKPPFSAVESARWLPSPVSTSAFQSLTNIMPAVPSHGAPVSIPNDMIPPLSGSGPLANQVAMRPPLSKNTPSSIGPIQPAMRPPPSNPAPMPFPKQFPGSLPQHEIPNSFSGNAPILDSIRPFPGATPRPQQPSSGDFTFQPHRPPNAAPQVWQNNQATPQNVRHPVQGGQASLGPQSSQMGPVMHNMNHPPIHGFPRPQVNQTRGQIPTNFAVPPRHQMMPGQNPWPMQPRNFVPRPMDNSLRPFPQEIHVGRPPRFPNPHQHFGNHPGRPFHGPGGGQQVYDPFSPTSASFNSQRGGNGARMPNESDPEYDDLMASVGVK